MIMFCFCLFLVCGHLCMLVLGVEGFLLLLLLLFCGIYVFWWWEKVYMGYESDSFSIFFFKWINFADCLWFRKLCWWTYNVLFGIRKYQIDKWITLKIMWKPLPDESIRSLANHNLILLLWQTWKMLFYSMPNYGMLLKKSFTFCHGFCLEIRMHACYPFNFVNGLCSLSLSPRTHGVLSLYLVLCNKSLILLSLMYVDNP